MLFSKYLVYITSFIEWVRIQKNPVIQASLIPNLLLIKNIKSYKNYSPKNNSNSFNSNAYKVNNKKNKNRYYKNIS